MAALREAHEEAAVPPDGLDHLFEHVFDLGYWSYTTVVMRVRVPFSPRVADHESQAVAWVPLHQVVDYPLHPGLAQAWPDLKARLGRMI